MDISTTFGAHLAQGTTTICHAWAITRSDGMLFGFTDHDLDLEFEGITFRADTGLSAVALQQSTGLAVDNTEAIGALSDAALRENEIEAGRFDGASVRAWLVNWANPAERALQFAGSLGELKRVGGVFKAELRGLSDALNRPIGRVYQKPCSAVLGDNDCNVDTSDPTYFATAQISQVIDDTTILIPSLPAYPAAWFARGRVTIQGISGVIKKDEPVENGRLIGLAASLRIPLVASDMLSIVAGCDKRFETCRAKFSNVLNFQGFPDLPGDDWSMAMPQTAVANSEGSRR